MITLFLDNFDGSDDLSTHAPDVGGAYNDAPDSPLSDLTLMDLDGAGRLLPHQHGGVPGQDLSVYAPLVADAGDTFALELVFDVSGTLFDEQLAAQLCATGEEWSFGGPGVGESSTSINLSYLGGWQLTVAMTEADGTPHELIDGPVSLNNGRNTLTLIVTPGSTAVYLKGAFVASVPFSPDVDLRSLVLALEVFSGQNIILARASVIGNFTNFWTEYVNTSESIPT